MKRFMLLIMIVIVANLYAQQEMVLKFIDTTKTGYSLQQQYVMPTNPLPVSAKGSSNWYAVDTSSTNGVDTINFGFTTRKVIIINDMANTDTLYFAKSGAFQTITTLKLVGGEAIVLDVGWTTAYFKTGYTPSGHLTKKKFRLTAY